MSRLTVVVENLVADVGPLLAEHGLSIWIEHNDTHILYDTGGGRALLPNLESLDYEPDQLNALVLSHGHYDHTGGLEKLLKVRRAPLPIYCHADVFSAHLDEENGALRNIGMSKSQKAYEDLGARFHFIERKANPWPGITLLADIPRVTPYEKPVPSLVTMHDGGTETDPFHDDLTLVIEGDQRIAVVTGCAHAGVINVLTDAEEHIGRKANFLIGGTHLGPAEPEQQQAAMEELARRQELDVAAGHCTGPVVAGYMQGMLGSRFTHMGVGRIFEI
ncbi:MBL fold metallo-hydrolase [Desulfovibrio inopinatus]|uniref:MBL fold metallo-hydrolase n=1 Tax=Desulfovibrio inopinatus TaxID=102109 RepID=UPI000402D95E|nr:MBL fold metallo-hydrolase [Desulfovibrio inopinatus]